MTLRKNGNTQMRRAGERLMTAKVDQQRGISCHVSDAPARLGQD
jgi:hypothetical protein